MKKTYYFDNTRMVYGGTLRVIGKAAFRSMQNDHTRTDYQHHWISGDFNSLAEAKEYFSKEWGKNRDE